MNYTGAKAGTSMISRATTALPALLLASLTALSACPVAAAEVFDIGLAANGSRIDAMVVEATVKSPPTVVLVGGLGNASATDEVRQAVSAYEKRRNRPVRLLAVPLPNAPG